MKRFYLTMLWLLRQSNSDARASLDSDCAMRFREIEGGLPPDTSYWVYNPTVVRTDGGNYHGLARVSLSLGDGGGCNAAEASRSGTSAEDVVAAADAVLYCRKWYSGGHRDLVIQWWAPADDICDARVAKILGEGEDPRLYRAAAGAAHPFYLTVQRWELLAFDDDFGAFEVTRAIYEAPVTARGGPANGELFDTRLVMEDRRSCGDYGPHDCPFELGKDYKAYWLWPRLLWACGGSPAGAGRMGWMFWASTWNATSHVDWRFPFYEDKNWSPFPDYATSGLMLFKFSPFVTCAVETTAKRCGSCVPRVRENNDARTADACEGATRRTLADLKSRGHPPPDYHRCVVHLNGVPLLTPPAALGAPAGAGLGVAHAVVHVRYDGRTEEEGPVVHALRDYDHFFFLASPDGVSRVSRPIPLRRKISHAPWFDFCDLRRDVVDDRTARKRRFAHAFGECGRNVAFVSGADATLDGGVLLSYGVGDRESRAVTLTGPFVAALFDREPRRVDVDVQPKKKAASSSEKKKRSRLRSVFGG